MLPGSHRKASALLLLLVALPSCGKTPEEDCTDLIGDICGRVPECAPASGLTEASCKDALAATLPCGKAVSVGQSYDACVSNVTSLSCATLFPNGQLALPANCQNVIQVQ